MLRNAYEFEGVVNDSWMLELVVGEEIELVQEVPYVDAAERVHLRKR